MEGPEPIMTTAPLEVVAAFVDGERVDTLALKTALAQPEARDYLADLIALREVMAQAGSTPAAAARPSRRWLIGAAAAVMLSLSGGYALGLRLGGTGTGDGSVVANTPAPQPTRVIEVSPGASNVPQGGR